MVISFAIAAVSRNLPDLAILTLVLLAQAGAVYFLLREPAAKKRIGVRRSILTCGALSGFVIIIGFLLTFDRVERHFSIWTGSWLRGWAMVWAMLSGLLIGAWILTKAVAVILKPEHSPARRQFFNVSRAALLAAPVAITGYGVFIQRHRVRMREQKIVIPGLAPDLDNLRIVQLTDIHLGPFLSERELGRAIAMANETNAHLALVTGDMISFHRDPLDVCLKHLSGLHSEAGIYGCLGNHEVYAQVEDYATEQGARLGIHYLRSQAVQLKFGGGVMNLAGVDYQRFHKPYLNDAEKLIQPGVLNLLMSHNPDVFPVAARQGYDLTIAGHTHGGQVRVEILREDLNIARFFTRYVDGLYRHGDRSIFVSRGIGTIGLPARLGAPPEVALLRLCRS